jgi:hypothetical protein
MEEVSRFIFFSTSFEDTVSWKGNKIAQVKLMGGLLRCAFSLGKLMGGLLSLNPRRKAAIA